MSFAGVPLSIEVQDWKLVFAENVGGRVPLNATPDIRECPFEICVHIRIQVSFGISCDVYCSLVGKRAYAIHVNSAVSSHSFVI